MSISDMRGDGASSLSRRSRRLLKSKRAWLVVVAAALGLSMGIPAASFADNASGCDFAATGTTESCLPPLSGSTFAGGDGNLLTNPTTFGTTDWQNVAGLNPGFDLPSGTGDNSFGQGTKEDDPNVSVVTGSIPPQKSDITRFYEASEFSSVNNDNFLYLAWERTNVLGTANFDFEINQATQPDLTTTGKKTLVRTAGDLLVTYDFTNGGGRPSIGLLRWLTSATVPVVPGFPTNSCFSIKTFPCWGDQATLDGTDSIAAVNNLDPVTDPLFPNSPNYINPVPALQFGETAIDLTKAGVFPPGTCKAFGSAFVRSRSSASFTAEIKDFVAPIPVNISNCGEIQIIKQTDPRGKNQVFSYTSTLPQNANAGGVACPTNTGIQSNGSFCLNDNGNAGKTLGSTLPADNSTGNTVDTGNTLPAGTYTVTEGADPAGFTFESLTCTGNSTTTTNGKIATITIAPNDKVVCLYINQQNTATMTTQVSNAGPVFPGTAVHDTATVTGNPPATATPTGTVTFFLCGPIATGSCSSGGTNIGTGTLSGSGATASANSPDVNTSAGLTPGRYCFRAEWPGDANYPAALTEFGGANGTNECFTVSDTTSSSSAQNWLPNDSATVTAGHGAPLNGSLSAQLYTGDNCGVTSGGPVSGQQYTKTLTNATSAADRTLTTNNTSFTVSTSSSVSWLVTFTSTDPNVQGSSHCESTSLTITN